MRYGVMIQFFSSLRHMDGASAESHTRCYMLLSFGAVVTASVLKIFANLLPL